MNLNQIVKEAEYKFTKAHEFFVEDIKKIRTGRAHPEMLDSVMVEAYGTPMPLNQVSTVTTPEAQLIQITPFDPNNLQAIVTAIRDNPSLGLNPSDDGRVVRVPIPALTEERRRDIVKTLNSKTEDAMISLRGVRHEALDSINKAKKDKELSEDEAKRLTSQIEDLMSKQKSEIENSAKAKEAEIMTV